MRVVRVHAYIEAMGTSALKRHIFRNICAMHQYTAVAAVDDQRLPRVIVQTQEIGLQKVQFSSFAERCAAAVAAAGSEEKQKGKSKKEKPLFHF